MYPKVFLDYMQDRLEYGRVSVLPTPLFFYGMEPGEEITVDIERGKSLIMRFVAVSEATKTARAPCSSSSTASRGRSRSPIAARWRRSRLAARRTPAMRSCGAPMPGTVATVRSAQGLRSRGADVLVTIEAMKMETSVRADRDGTIAEVVTKPGETVDAKDLLCLCSGM